MRIAILSRLPWRGLKSVARALLRAIPMALLLAPTGMAQQHAGGYTPADVENGARLYGAHCSACHGAEGNQVAGVDLRLGQFRRGSTDEELMRTIRNGIPGTAMTGTRFTPAELTAVVAYLRSMRDFKTRAVTLGDAARGRALFEGKGGCLSCHRVAGNGARTAADLSDIGASRSAEALERSLAEPEAMVPAQRRFVRAVTADGRVITGRRLNEDTFTVQLLDDKERLVSLAKKDLKEYSVSRKSPMHSYREKFSAAELSDLVAFLVSLKGPDKGPGGSERR